MTGSPDAVSPPVDEAMPPSAQHAERELVLGCVRGGEILSHTVHVLSIFLVAQDMYELFHMYDNASPMVQRRIMSF